jgi:integrase
MIADTFERASRGELKRETEIRETLLELVELAGGPLIREPSAREFFNRWVDDSERAGKTETTLRRYRQVAREFTAHLAAKAEAPISHVTATDVQDFVHALTGKDLASKTVSNALKVLRVPFEEARRLGTLSFNPAAAVKPPNVVSVERKAFAPAEIKMLLSACEGFEDGGEWATAIHFGYYAAMRLGDATGLSWGCIDFERRLIAFTPEKTRGRGRKVEIPMHPALERRLMGLPLPEGPAALVTPALNAPAGARPKLSKAFARLLARAGVDNPQEKANAGKGRRNVSTKSFHALRHSLASHLAGAGVPSEIRMKFTGHTDARTHAGYTHHEIEALRAELEKLPG